MPSENISLSTTWQVFAGLTRDDPVLPPEALSSIPAEIAVGGRRVKAQAVAAPYGVVDLGPLHGGHARDKAAYVFASLEVHGAGEVRLGFGADWFLQVWLDGKPVLDTLESGNLAYPISKSNHIVTRNLSGGRHVLAARIISGETSSVLALGLLKGPGASRGPGSEMTTRDLWREIMFYGAFNRMPVIHWAGWDETHERWIKEGMPELVDPQEYFQAAQPWRIVSANMFLYPAFDEETLEDAGEHRIFRDSGGVIQKAWKHKGCIPHFIDFTLKEAKDWPEYKKRLQPHPGRLYGNLDETIKTAEASGDVIAIGIAPMMGWIRNWMGVENMSFLMYDDQDCYADMVMTLADLTCWGIDQVVPKMQTKPNLGFGWEDICGKSGPLVSPDIFRKCVAPGYRKIRSKLEGYGITLLGIDSDGLVEPLIPHWLESGVNLQFPIEYGTWQATPEHMREKFGKELRIVGGFNKLVLEKGRAAIDAEIERHIPLMKEGGFVMMPDHLITPDTPLEDYRYYLDRVRALRF